MNLDRAASVCIFLGGLCSLVAVAYTPVGDFLTRVEVVRKALPPEKLTKVKFHECQSVLDHFDHARGKGICYVGVDQQRCYTRPVQACERVGFADCWHPVRDCEPWEENSRSAYVYEDQEWFGYLQ